MTMSVFMARHGETVWHGADRYTGISDVGLTETGRRQADALAAWAERADLTEVWSSTLVRARDTAVGSAAACGLELQVDSRLTELDFGVAEGLTREQLAERYPDEFAAFKRDPVGHHFPQGEDPIAAVARYRDFLGELHRRSDGGRVLIVAHSTAMRLTFCRLLGIDLNRYRRVFPRLANCAVTEWRFGSDAALITLNCPV